MIVVDTNVLVYLCTDSPHRAAAEAWWVRDPDWWVPAIALTETANVLAGFVRRGALTGDDAAAACRVLQARLQIADPPEMVPVLALALATGLSAYDAEFVLAARALGTSLVTHDKAILRTCADTAVSVVD